MAQAVRKAIVSGEHLAVQAGTGTGKSLAYLVPAIRHAVERGNTVVVSTATIALQRQLVDRDLPRLAKALKPLLGRAPTFAILKGRRNYLCLNKLHGNGDDVDDGEQLFDPFAISAMGRTVKRIHEWSSDTETGDRDELVPGVPESAWRQVSVSARECLGASRCPVGDDCFAEKARAEAGRADVVVTNHALLAIDALEGRPVLPEHDVVIVDEAHELVDRITGVATAELTTGAVTAAARRCGKLVDQAVADRLVEAGEGLALILDDLPPGRWENLPRAGRRRAHRRARRRGVVQAVARRRAPGGSRGCGGPQGRAVRARRGRRHRVPPAQRLRRAGRRASARRRVARRAGPRRRPEPGAAGGAAGGRRAAAGAVVRAQHRDPHVGDADAGRDLRRAGPAVGPPAGEARSAGRATDGMPVQDPDAPKWSGMDVGSPFQHAKSGILYVAKRLPPPGRDGLPPAYLDEIAGLVEAAGGRTLGLFSSMRAAKQATEALRGRLDTPLLCQGDDATMLLVRRFAEDEATSLFGTLSLWQGVDVPGPSLSCVIIDRIPFPRPDDPLVAARQRAADSRGGNGFLTVSATHAALLLAQGAGRLLRGMGDRGVVAVLDPRLATARYGGFLRASLPPFWQTDDREKVLGALRRLRDATP